MSKVNVIYIAGSGHCGSTLFDMLLGSGANAVSVGELSFYNAYRKQIILNTKRPKELCTCGQNFNNCPFWNEIDPDGDCFIRKKYSVFENIQIAISILVAGKLYKKKFLDDSATLFSKIASSVSSGSGNEAKWVVDSSKDPRRLFTLMKDPQINVYPILLVRHPGGVLSSYLKANKRPGLKSENVFKILIQRWLVVYFFSMRLLKQNSTGMVVNYTDFCESPQNFIKTLNNSLNLDISEKQFIDKINATEYHNVDGNRVKKSKLESIRLDNSWKSKLNGTQRFIVNTIMSPFTKLWMKTKII